MDNLLTVAFEAHHADKNHHRRYPMTVGRDLLDDWTIAICHGRPEQQPGGRVIMRERLRWEALLLWLLQVVEEAFGVNDATYTEMY